MSDDRIVINNLLSWDGSELENNVDVKLGIQWNNDGRICQEILCPVGWMGYQKECKIYCIITVLKDLFPCIVEDLKPLFGLPRRGIHRITIQGKKYIIYYVQLSNKNEIMWEKTVDKLETKHQLRQDPRFRKLMQKTILFSELLSLSNTTESKIGIRYGTNNEYIPISYNETSTTVAKSYKYDHSILTKTIIFKWFGESTNISDIVKEMVYYKIIPRIGVPGRLRIPMINESGSDPLVILTANLRSKIDAVIKNYDPTYIWYSNVIIGRLSRYLLDE